MYEARCGMCGDESERKEEVHCTGCGTMEKTSWGGDCGVKSCCEARRLNHCGECEEFPCTMEATMGAERGFDPAPRLEHCRKWAGEKPCPQ